MVTFRPLTASKTLIWRGTSLKKWARGRSSALRRGIEKVRRFRHPVGGTKLDLGGPDFQVFHCIVFLPGPDLVWASCRDLPRPA